MQRQKPRRFSRLAGSFPFVAATLQTFEWLSGDLLQSAAHLRLLMLLIAESRDHESITPAVGRYPPEF